MSGLEKVKINKKEISCDFMQAWMGGAPHYVKDENGEKIKLKASEYLRLVSLEIEKATLSEQKNRAFSSQRLRGLKEANYTILNPFPLDDKLEGLTGLPLYLKGIQTLYGITEFFPRGFQDEYLKRIERRLKYLERVGK